MGLSPNPDISLTLLYKVFVLLFWIHAHGIFYHFQCYWPQNLQEEWPSAKKRWFKAPVSSVPWVQDPLLSFCRQPIQSIVSFILKTCTWYLVPLSMLLNTKHTGRMAEWYEALFHGYQSLRCCGFKFHSCHFVDIQTQRLVYFILNTWTWYLLLSSMQFNTQQTSRMAEW